MNRTGSRPARDRASRRGLIALLLGVCLAAASSARAAPAAPPGAPPLLAEEARPPGGERPPGFTLLPPRSFLVPAIELPLFHVALLAYDEHVVWKGDPRVSGETIWKNVKGGWTLDGDSLWMNYFGHPIHGALHFNAARSNQLTFLESFAFAVGSAWLWEVAGEAEPPSTNDFSNSALMGSLLGEVFHRMSQQILDGPRPPNAVGWVGATLLNPFGVFNRLLLGEREPRSLLPELPPWQARLQLGGLAQTSDVLGAAPGSTLRAPALAGTLGLQLVYGFPGDGGARTMGPMDHFELRADLAYPGSSSANLSLRGLLVGRSFGEGAGDAGAWGLFGILDIVSAPTFRVGDNAFGPGVTLEKPVGEGRLRATAVLSALPVAAVGTRDQMDTQAQINAPRLFTAGSGFQGLLEAELADARGRSVRVEAQLWRVRAIHTGGQWERVESLSVGGRLPLFAAGQGLDAELTLLNRHGVPKGLHQAGLLGRLAWSVPFGR